MVLSQETSRFKDKDCVMGRSKQKKTLARMLQPTMKSEPVHVSFSGKGKARGEEMSFILLECLYRDARFEDKGANPVGKVYSLPDRANASLSEALPEPKLGRKSNFSKFAN